VNLIILLKYNDIMPTFWNCFVMGKAVFQQWYAWDMHVLLILSQYVCALQ